VRDVAWFGTDGNEISDEAWGESWNRSVAVMFNGRTMNAFDEDGEPVVDDSFLIIVNAAAEGVEYALPDPPNKTPWRQVLDTENVDDPFAECDVHDKAILGGRAVRVYSDALVKEARKKPAKTV